MTYKSRLVFYVSLLVVLLVGMMMLSFQAARDVIAANSEDQLHHVAARQQEILRAQRLSLLLTATRIAADPFLQEMLQTGAAPASHYQSRFAGFEGDVRILLSADGEALLGGEFTELIDAMLGRSQGDIRDQFYLQDQESLTMIATAPVLVKGRVIARVAVGLRLDHAWLQRQAAVVQDSLLFFSRHGRVLWSSAARPDHLTVDGKHGNVRREDQSFRLQEIELQEAQPGMPRLMLGIAESRLFGELHRFAAWVYLFTVLGGAAVLMVGWLMLRNFEQPYSQLMRTTQELLDGKLPVVARSESNTEMDQLVNRFADVLDTLRHEQQELKQVHDRLQHTAITDSLTRLYNRRYLQEVAPGLFAQVERDERYLTAILLDLDHFKEINDSHGHLGGDAVLVHFSRLLKHNSRVNDHLFRIGGEEFLILNVAEDPQDSVALADKLRELVEASPANYLGTVIPVTVSSGISCCYGAAGSGSLSQLLRGADKALYEAKANGRNCVVLHSSCRKAAAQAENHAGVQLVKSEAVGKHSA